MTTVKQEETIDPTRGERLPAWLPAHLSHSQISKYRQCGKAYELAYREGVPSIPSGAGIGGSTVHKVIEVCEAEGLWRDLNAFGEGGGVEDLFRGMFTYLVEEAFDTSPYPVRWGTRKSKEFPEGEAVRWWWKMGPMFLRRYASLRQIDQEHGIKVLEGDVERAVGVHLDIESEPVLIKGYIDAVMMVDEETGEGIIRDYKTGTWLDPTQLAVYAWMLSKDPKRPWTITRGEFGYLRGANQDAWIKSYDLTDWVPLVPMFFREAAEGIASGYFPHNPTSLCSSCLVKKSCKYGITLGEET